MSCKQPTCHPVNIAIVSTGDSFTAPVIESFWARPVDSENYEICNVLYRFPLVMGDQVTVSEGTNGELVVNGVAKIVPGWYVRGQLTDNLPRATSAFNDLEQTALELESGHGAFFGRWSADYTFDNLTEILQKVHPSVGLAEIYHEISRRDWLDEAVDFNAGMSFEPKALEYWAANDPKWRELGLTSPDFLAHVQTLVRRHPDLLRLIESRRYDKAVRWINKYDQVYRRLTKV